MQISDIIYTSELNITKICPGTNFKVSYASELGIGEIWMNICEICDKDSNLAILCIQPWEIDFKLWDPHKLEA